MSIWGFPLWVLWFPPASGRDSVCKGVCAWRPVQGTFPALCAQSWRRWRNEWSSRRRTSRNTDTPKSYTIYLKKKNVRSSRSTLGAGLKSVYIYIYIFMWKKGSFPHEVKDAPRYSTPSSPPSPSHLAKECRINLLGVSSARDGGDLQSLRSGHGLAALSRAVESGSERRREWCREWTRR